MISPVMLLRNYDGTAYPAIQSNLTAHQIHDLLSNVNFSFHFFGTLQRY